MWNGEGWCWMLMPNGNKITQMSGVLIWNWFIWFQPRHAKWKCFYRSCQNCIRNPSKWDGEQKHEFSSNQLQWFENRWARDVTRLSFPHSRSIPVMARKPEFPTFSTWITKVSETTCKWLHKSAVKCRTKQIHTRH